MERFSTSPKTSGRKIMSKTYTLESNSDFLDFIAKMGNYFKLREEKNLPFEKLTLVCKRYKKPKSSQQHKFYWSLVGKLKKVFIKNGTRTNEAEIHEFLKKSVGFTTVLNDVMITKSISDMSDDASSLALNNLIEFVIQFAAETFDVNLEDNRAI